MRLLAVGVGSQLCAHGLEARAKARGCFGREWKAGRTDKHERLTRKSPRPFTKAAVFFEPAVVMLDESLPIVLELRRNQPRMLLQEVPGFDISVADYVVFKREILPVPAVEGGLRPVKLDNERHEQLAVLSSRRTGDLAVAHPLACESAERLDRPGKLRQRDNRKGDNQDH